MVSSPKIPNRVALWLSTGCGVGYLPKMPGTYGSAEGVLTFAALHWLLVDTAGVIGLAVAILAAVAASVWLTALALPQFTSSDPHAIVIDEIVGQMVTLAALLFWPRGSSWCWYHLVVGFGLFRILDITKPLFIRKLEQWHGAWGVVADDLGAGLVGAVILLAWGYLAR